MASDNGSNVYYGVPFITPFDEARGVVVRQGIIKEVVYSQRRLDDLLISTKSTNLYDCRYPDACVVPGFVMSHTHFSTYSILTKSVRVSPMNIFFDDDYIPPKTSQEVLQRLRGSQSHCIFSQGYDPVLQPGKIIDRLDLDTVSETGCVYLMSASMHTIYVNTQVLVESGLVTRHPSGIDVTAKVPDGAIDQVLSGTLSEENVCLISSPTLTIQPHDLTLRMLDGARKMRSRGITTVGDAAVQDTMFSFYKQFALDYHAIRIVGFPVYTPKSPFLTPSHGSIVQLDYKKFFENSCLIVGPMKVIGDGSIQGYTAYLRQPYASPPFFDVSNPDAWRGQYNYPGIELHAAFGDILRAGMNIAVHGNGDGDIDLILAALMKVNEVWDVSGRVRLEHSSLVTADQLDTIKKLGIHTSFLGHHVFYYGDVFYDQILGSERSERIHPFKTAQNMGVGWDIHSDAPVSPPDPLFEMWSAINRTTSSGRILGKEERVSPIEALSACTILPAISLGISEKVGSIEEGKYADFNLISSNLNSDLRNTKVLKSFLSGKE